MAPKNKTLLNISEFIKNVKTLEYEKNVLKSDRDESIQRKETKIAHGKTDLRKEIESYIISVVGVKKPFHDWLLTSVLRNPPGVEMKNNLDLVSLMITKVILKDIDEKFPTDYIIVISVDIKEGETLYKKFKKDLDYISKCLGVQYVIGPKKLNFSITFTK